MRKFVVQFNETIISIKYEWGSKQEKPALKLQCKKQKFDIKNGVWILITLLNTTP
jgi:hypothetical protein